MSATASEMRQKFDALEKANWVRLNCAQLKRDIRSGVVSLVSVLESPPDYAQAMKVYHLLMALPRIGTTKAAKLLRHHTVNASPFTTLGGMSDRQRRELIVQFQRSGIGRRHG
jgi:hypothetical protein